MNRARIIGMTGYARAGKDTAGQVLVREYGYTRVALADQVRSLALAINPFISGGNIRLHHAVNNVGWDEAKKIPEVRRLLQVIGTEGVREHIDDQAWIFAARRKIDQISGPVVVTDVRFPNEAEAILNWGGQLWRIIRVNGDGTPYDNGVDTSHGSERFIEELGAFVSKTIVAADVHELGMKVREHMGPPAEELEDAVSVDRLMELADRQPLVPPAARGL